MYMNDNELQEVLQKYLAPHLEWDKEGEGGREGGRERERERYESLAAEARSRKRAKYHDLVEAGRAAGYKTDLITVEVGSRGMLGDINV